MLETLDGQGIWYKYEQFKCLELASKDRLANILANKIKVVQG